MFECPMDSLGQLLGVDPPRWSGKERGNGQFGHFRDAFLPGDWLAEQFLADGEFDARVKSRSQFFRRQVLREQGYWDAVEDARTLERMVNLNATLAGKVQVEQQQTGPAWPS